MYVRFFLPQLNCFSEALDVHYSTDERIVIQVGAVTNACLIGVYGVDGVIQYLADLVIVVNAEPDERENTQFGRKQLIAFDGQFFPFSQKRIEIPDEVREDMQERLIELLVEIPSAVMGINVIGDDDQFIRPFLLGFAAYEPFITFQPADQV